MPMPGRASGGLLLVVCCLLVAGCSGPTDRPGPTPDTPTLTPADVPEAADLEGGRLLAPGLSTDGVFDPGALARAHRDRLSTTSYRVVRNRTVRYANESLAAPTDRQSLDFVHEEAVVATDVTAYRFTKLETSGQAWVAAEPYSRVDVWYDAPLVRNRLVDTGGTERFWGFDDEPAGGPLAGPSAHRLVRADLSAVKVRVVDREAVGDRTVYRLRGSRLVDAENLSVPPLGTDPRNVSFTASVDSRGVVRSYTLAYDATFTVDGSTLRVRQTHRLTAVGEATVGRPDWLSTANESVASAG
jgi:hypothetical protein